jgi:hypothetical protein
MSLIPPTVLRWIQERCAHALTPIESGLTTDEEIEVMKADLNAARNYLTVTVARAQNTDLDKEITERENRLQPELDRLAATYAQCTGLVNQVQEAINSHTPPSPVNYSARDVRSLKADLLWTFDQRKQQISGAADALKRLEDCLPKLMEYLVADTHESLRMARLIVDEMRQDIYQDALTSEVTQSPPAMTITTDPAAVHAQSPVRLALRFKRQLLNEAVARQAWTCTWDFGDGTPHEDGWEVFHRYDLPGTQQVQITIRDLDGNPVIAAPVREHVPVGNGPGQSRLRRGLRFVSPEPETRLELVQLALVLALALLGLMTTARQQAQNLSFLEAVGAVVALGFGADTIKNLIVQRSSSR